MKGRLKERWWITPPVAAGLIFTVGFIALIHAHESWNPEEEEERRISPAPAAEKSKRKKKDRWWLWPLGAMALAIVINLFVLVNANVPSGSMEPAIPTGALMVGDRTAYHRGDPQTGDVVLFRHPEFGDKVLVKRVVALPGQTFSMENGRVYIDGRLLEEDYITEFSSDSYSEITVPEDCYVVLGDHRTNSNDSRFWKDPFVRRENLLARALFTYFPRPGLL